MGVGFLRTEEFCPEDIWQRNLPVQMLLHQVVHLHRQYVLHMMKPTGLKIGQAGILVVLGKTGPLSQREIADKIHVTPPSVTVALQKLEKMEYIERHPDEKDQRVMRIALSEKGNEFVKEMEVFWKKTESVLFKNMSTEERLLFRRLLLQMRDNILASEEVDLKVFPEQCI